VKPLSLAINGGRVQAEVEPRLNLADFLREHQFLTGTHIGCEHGVCGACTVMIDGVPARSCITFAIAADGAEVTTLEGLEDDHVVNVLREAFSEHHGLQCGFCTPGMLMTARDIVTRLPDADERRIRLELSGNLCRCTGYVGIVEAVKSALATLKTSGRAGAPAGRRIGPVGSHRPAKPQDFSQSTLDGNVARKPPPATKGADGFASVDWASVERDGVELRQSFSIPFDRPTVWRFFADLDQVTQCMPGARLTTPVEAGRAEGEVTVKLGPIVSAFQGVLQAERNDETFHGVVRGAGRDTRSPSSARAIIAYEVRALDAAASQVDVSVTFLLSGALAQFSRSGLVKDVADHLTRVFARNLEARLSGAPAAIAPAEVLDAGAVARSAIWTRISAVVRRIFGR
jgi:aerobic carbon-monoxide dehydrogenase small subunit